MHRRAALLAPALLAIAACGSSVDSWSDQQAARLADAGVTFPVEQERNTVIAMTSACVIREAADDPGVGRWSYATATSSNYDWLTPEEAGRMYDLADDEFCTTLPDGPLGES